MKFDICFVGAGIMVLVAVLFYIFLRSMELLYDE